MVKSLGESSYALFVYVIILLNTDWNVNKIFKCFELSNLM